MTGQISLLFLLWGWYHEVLSSLWGQLCLSVLATLNWLLWFEQKMESKQNVSLVRSVLLQYELWMKEMCSSTFFPRWPHDILARASSGLKATFRYTTGCSKSECFSQLQTFLYVLQKASEGSFRTTLPPRLRKSLRTSMSKICHIKFCLLYLIIIV